MEQSEKKMIDRDYEHKIWFMKLIFFFVVLKKLNCIQKDRKVKTKAKQVKLGKRRNKKTDG